MSSIIVVRSDSLIQMLIAKIVVIVIATFILIMGIVIFIFVMGIVIYTFSHLVI